MQSVSRQELRQLVCSELKGLLELGNLEAAKVVLIPVQPVDIAEAIEGLPEAMQAIAFRLLSKDRAIEVYEYLDSSVQQGLIEDLKRHDVLEVIDNMSPDDRARLFDELPAKVVRRLLVGLSHQQREATALLLGYKPNTAGRIMTPEYISLKASWSVSQAFERTRSLADTSETIYSLYVTDAAHRLLGNLSLRDLVIAQPEQTIDEIMNPHVICVYTDTEQEEVARELQHYDFIALPVVDAEQRLVGIVTVDDVIDILEEETTKDIHNLGGIQSGGDRYFQTSILKVVGRRLFWLLFVFCASSLAGVLLRVQEEFLMQVIALIAFIPFLIDSGGDVGAQSSTTVIRGISTNEIRSNQALWVIGREAMAGALLGLILGVITIPWSYLLQGDWLVSLVVGISLFIITVLATVAGSALVFLFYFLGLDPALMSIPLMTTIIDILGIIVYLYVARLILGF
ncbi:MAG: magnesium transporter [Symploca sp. SIO3C6]|nr:magnesium transporter [Symploca sp. SIO3C6]